MPDMVRSALCLALAVVILAGYVPLPARGGAMGISKPASCCAIKACCRAARGAAHVCVATGAACESPTGMAGRGGAPRSAAAPWLLAGGCGTQTPLVTPVNLDPTLAPHEISLGAIITARVPIRGTDDLTFLGHIPDPQVPPPRA